MEPMKLWWRFTLSRTSVFDYVQIFEIDLWYRSLINQKIDEYLKIFSGIVIRRITNMKQTKDFEIRLSAF